MNETRRGALQLPPKPQQPIPLHFVGGLFGSGKTTLIQHWIAEAWSKQKLGLILCEEGERKLDVSNEPKPRVERLLNACVCCEMAYSFFEVILDMLRDASIERIVVEVTAQADIRQILGFIQSSYLKDYLLFEPIHVLVDPRNPHMRRHSTSPLVQRMVDQADVFVVGFHDVATVREMERCMGWIQSYETGEKKYQLSPWKRPASAEHPVLPSAEHPVLPSAEHPALPSAEHPALPSAEYPVLPSAEHPVLPSAEYPVLPSAEYPVLPSAEYPVLPSAEYPVLPSA